RRAAALETDPAWRFVRGVPFIPQRADSDCGPAALAMVLSHFGVQTSLAELAGLSPPDRVGVRAGGLRDVARAKGMEAFVVEGTFIDLIDQLSRDRPVLVGLAKPITGGRALAHYEVVVGIDRSDKKIVTLDPSRGLRENSLEGFAKEWVPTGRVTLIVFPRAPRASGLSCGGPAEVYEGACPRKARPCRPRPRWSDSRPATSATSRTFAASTRC
ncbi:MAG: cysteine peptidase family C39 domain-containing protein, partial [Pseudomonadota bacterium]